MIDAGLLKVAGDLATKPGAGTADYRVAISTAYYALFHCFAEAGEKRYPLVFGGFAERQGFAVARI